MKINLDMGHTLSGGDTGAEGCGRKEQNCTREIGYKVKYKLETLGHSVNVCSVDSATTMQESLANRVNNANSHGGDIYVSIHLNAGGGHGTEIYTYNGRELLQARNVLNNICRLGYTNRGIKSANLYVINHTSMPAMLIECCFIDNNEDMAKYNAENIANAIVKGLLGQTSNSTSEYVPTLGNKILELQRILNHNHFLDFEGRSLLENGILGKRTLSACPLLKKGAIGDLVKWLQLRVGENADGVFGQSTENSVKGYQNSKGLKVDGIVGKNTWRELCK